MKKEINDILLDMQNGKICVGEASSALVNLFEKNNQSLLDVCNVILKWNEYSKDKPFNPNKDDCVSVLIKASLPKNN